MLQKLHISIVSKAWNFIDSLNEVKNTVINWINRGFGRNDIESYSFRVEDVNWNEVYVEDTWKEDWVK